MIDKVQKTDGYTDGIGRVHKKVRRNCAKRAPKQGSGEKWKQLRRISRKDRKTGNFRRERCENLFQTKIKLKTLMGIIDKGSIRMYTGNGYFEHSQTAKRRKQNV